MSVESAETRQQQDLRYPYLDSQQLLLLDSGERMVSWAPRRILKDFNGESVLGYRLSTFAFHRDFNTINTPDLNDDFDSVAKSVAFSINGNVNGERLRFTRLKEQMRALAQDVRFENSLYTSAQHQARLRKQRDLLVGYAWGELFHAAFIPTRHSRKSHFINTELPLLHIQHTDNPLESEKFDPKLASESIELLDTVLANGIMQDEQTLSRLRHLSKDLKQSLKSSLDDRMVMDQAQPPALRAFQV